MTIYAKKLNAAQRNAMAKYEGLSGFEPMGQDDFDAGRITFEEMWQKNVRWLESLMADVTNIDLSGTEAP